MVGQKPKREPRVKVGTPLVPHNLGAYIGPFLCWYMTLSIMSWNGDSCKQLRPCVLVWVLAEEAVKQKCMSQSYKKYQ